MTFLSKPQIPWLYQSDPCEISSCQFWPGTLVSWHILCPGFAPSLSFLLTSSPHSEVGCPLTPKHRPNGHPFWLLRERTLGWRGGPSESKTLHFWESEDVSLVNEKGVGPEQEATLSTQLLGWPDAKPRNTSTPQARAQLRESGRAGY